LPGTTTPGGPSGDFSDVPLAHDFRFTGPVASLTAPRAIARWRARRGRPCQQVRRQFVDGDTVCSIVDWEMAIAGVGPMTAAGLFRRA
jgi:hypothetical protein